MWVVPIAAVARDGHATEDQIIDSVLSQHVVGIEQVVCAFMLLACGDRSLDLHVRHELKHCAH